MDWIVGFLCWAGVAMTMVFAAYKLLCLWSQANYWFRSTHEEKANLTRSGIYNANGYLMKNDADDFVGENFHRFDVVDAEYSMTAMTIFPISHSESSIPPQPLRPAPIIIPQEPRSPNHIVESSVAFEEKNQEKTDSFYLYNISTAITRSLISADMSKEINLDCSTSQSISLTSNLSPMQKMNEAADTTDNDQNDWNTRNNLNIFKKPEYISTNPFLTNANQVNCQFNPFFAKDSAYYETGLIEESLSDGRTSQFTELTNECDRKFKNMHQPSRFQMLIRKNSFDNDPNEDVSANSAVSGTAGAVRRAISCDSVSSDTSLGPLETPLPTVTGQLCLSLRCYRINANDALLAVNVIEARNLPGDAPDTYVGIFLSPDHQGGHFKSKICRGTNCPSYNETFLVDIGKGNKKLSFHVYSTENEACSLIGEAELSLQDASSYKQPVTTWLTLTDTGQGNIEFGELMLSLSYLPTAERLTLILARARRLPDPMNFNVFVKVYLQRNGKKVDKKRSSIKSSETAPTFNEAFIFSVPPQALSSVELRVTLVYYPIGVEFFHITQHQKIGHILLSREAHSKAGNHWNQMVTSLRRPVSMWHALRRPHNM